MIVLKERKKEKKNFGVFECRKKERKNHRKIGYDEF